MKSFSLVALTAGIVISATAPRLTACYGGQNRPDPLVLLVLSDDANTAHTAYGQLAKDQRGLRRAQNTLVVLRTEIDNQGEQIDWLRRAVVQVPLSKQGAVLGRIVELQMDRADRRIKAQRLEPVIKRLEDAASPRIASAR